MLLLTELSHVPANQAGGGHGRGDDTQAGGQQDEGAQGKRLEG